MGPPAGPGLVVFPLFDVPAGGEALVAGYGFTGHGRNEAAGELVERAIAMGYLSYGEEMLEAWSGETACDPNRSCLSRTGYRDGRLCGPDGAARTGPGHAPGG